MSQKKASNNNNNDDKNQAESEEKSLWEALTATPGLCDSLASGRLFYSLSAATIWTSIYDQFLPQIS